MGIGDQLKSAGWTVERCEKQSLPQFIVDRYPWILKHQQLVEFMETHSEAGSDDEWFATADTLRGDDTPWAWNEWELQSLDVEDDLEWKTEVTSFWDKHFPFFHSVKHSAYAAIKEDLTVVSGIKPEFEEAEPLADSIDEFLEMLVNGEIEY